MCDSDLEGPRVWSTRTHVARKTYRCDACREAIEPGHRYHYTFGVWDDPATMRHCQRCWAMLDVLMQRVNDPVDLYLDCGETWQSAFGETPPDHVAELAFLLPGEAPGTLIPTEPKP